MIPNMYRNMAQLPGLLTTYAEGYQQFRAEGGFTPAEQEVVLLAISHENECAYCIAAHSTLAAGPSRVPRDTVHAIRLGGNGTDPRLAALAAFTRVMVQERGHPSGNDLASFLAAGYTERHVLSIVLAIGVKTISNYANHLFNTPVDAPFLDWAWTPGVPGIASGASVPSAA
ncbi:MAG: carboxymuconolactone decarboxylase family protein [Gemmatimonadaceae bacterium]